MSRRHVDCDRLFDDEATGPRRPHAVDPDDPRRRHLVSCPRCRLRSRALDAGRAALRALPEIEPSPDFLPRLEARLAAMEAARGHRRQVALAVGRTGSGLVLAAAVVAALWLNAAGEGPEPAPATALAALEHVTPPSFDPSPAPAASPLETFDEPGTDALDLQPALDWSLILASATPGVLSRSFGRLTETGHRTAALQPMLYAAPSLTFAAAPVSLRFTSAVTRPAAPAE